MTTSTPIRVSEHVYALPLAITLAGNPSTIHPALILDPAGGATLVDTGTPGQHGALGEALNALGLTWPGVRRVVITHHDLDHLGSLPEVVAASGAEVLTSEAEAPYVRGERRGQKVPPPDMLAAMPPGMAAHFENPPRAAVTRLLRDGEVLDGAGRVRVVLTPGHTVGHLSLFVEDDGVLIAGDALTSRGGELHGPMERMTPDLDEARRSVRKLAGLPASKVLTYHGGLVEDGTQLARLAETSAS